MPGFSRNRYAEILEPLLLFWGESSTQPASLDPKYNSHSATCWSLGHKMFYRSTHGEVGGGVST